MLSLLTSLRGRKLINCLTLRPPIRPNALLLIDQLVIEIPVNYADLQTPI